MTRVSFSSTGTTGHRSARLIALTFLFFTVLIFHWLSLPAMAQESVVGVVKTAGGDSVIERGGISIPAEVGTELMLGDKLLTAKDGHLGIALDDGTLLSIGSASNFEIKAFHFVPSQSLFEFIGRLLEGRLIYESGLIEESAPEKIRIETPYATVGARGTRFALAVPKGASR